MKPFAAPRVRLLPVVAIAAAAVAHGQEQPAYENVKEAVEGLVPDAEEIAVSETPLPNLLEVQVNSEILYLSESGRYLIQGRLFDLESRRDLTSEAKSKVRRELMNSLDPEEQITFAPEKPEHEVIVFTDVDCGYCRRLHSQIDEYNDRGIAVHYMAYPRSGVGSASFKKAESVWCADDRQAALTRAKQGKDVQPRQCDNPVQAQFQLGKKIGMSGTPAIVTSDGVLIPGYVPPGALEERLEGLAKEGASSR